MIQNPVETQIYLIAPPLDALDTDALSAVLGTGSVACLLADISGYVDAQAESLDAMLACAHAAECPLVVGGDDALALDLAKRFALDGVNLRGAPKQAAWARKQLGPDAIIGYDAETSRHNAMIAAEAGADYVMLGPLAELEDGLVAWWAAVIETPLVVSGVKDSDGVTALAGAADFILWSGIDWGKDPKAALTDLVARL